MVDIDTTHLLKLLHAIEHRGAIETALRLQQRISDIFVFAMAAGIS